METPNYKWGNYVKNILRRVNKDVGWGEVEKRSLKWGSGMEGLNSKGSQEAF